MSCWLLLFGCPKPNGHVNLCMFCRSTKFNNTSNHINNNAVRIRCIQSHDTEDNFKRELISLEKKHLKKDNFQENWLVVSTSLKNISQNGFIFPKFLGGNKKCLSCHQPDNHTFSWISWAFLLHPKLPSKKPPRKHSPKKHTKRQASRPSARSRYDRGRSDVPGGTAFVESERSLERASKHPAIGPPETGGSRRR